MRHWIEHRKSQPGGAPDSQAIHVENSSRPEHERRLDHVARQQMRAESAFLGHEKVVVWSARPVDWDGEAPAGTVVEDGPVVACGEGALLLEEIESSAPLEIGAQLG